MIGLPFIEISTIAEFASPFESVTLAVITWIPGENEDVVVVPLPKITFPSVHSINPLKDPSFGSDAVPLNEITTPSENISRF